MIVLVSGSGDHRRRVADCEGGYQEGVTMINNKEDLDLEVITEGSVIDKKGD